MENDYEPKKDVYLNLGGVDWLNRPPLITIHDMSNHELEDGFGTLRDIAIILDRCVGQGAMWNLSREISRRSHLPLRIINQALHDTIREYAKMTVEDGFNKWETTASHISDKREIETNKIIKKLEKRKKLEKQKEPK